MPERCSNCKKTIYFFSKTYKTIKGVLCSDCNKELEYEKKGKHAEALIEQNIVKIKPLLKKLFDTEEEYKYAAYIFKDVFRRLYHPDFSPNMAMFIPDSDIIGHKKSVVNFFREVDFLSLYKRRYLLNFLVYDQSRILSDKDKNVISDIIVDELQDIVKKELKREKHYSQKRFICSECEYKWQTKKKFGQPFKCPRCNSQKIIAFKDLNKILSKPNRPSK